MKAIKESNPEAFLTISYKSGDASNIDGIILHALVKDPNKERETIAISFIENTEIHLPLQYYTNPTVGKLILRDFSVSMNLEPITKTQDNSSFTFIDLPKDTPVIVSEAIRLLGLNNDMYIPLESFEGKLLHALYDSIYFKGDCNTYKKLLVNIIERDACDYSQTLEDVQSSASLLKAYGIQLTNDMFIEGTKHYVVKMTYRETGNEALCFAVDYLHLSRLLPILDKASR